MKKYALALAIVISIPFVTFAAVKAATGIELVTSSTSGGQRVSRWKDNDTGVLCYTAQMPIGNTQYVSISCVK